MPIPRPGREGSIPWLVVGSVWITLAIASGREVGPVGKITVAVALGRRRLPVIGRPVLIGPLQQRIALELVLDKRDEVEIRQLQQLDRLHELRRHHQRLRLAEL